MPYPFLIVALARSTPERMLDAVVLNHFSRKGRPCRVGNATRFQCLQILDEEVYND
jgi:hypothetical protein